MPRSVSVLLVDDNHHALEDYTRRLECMAGIIVTSQTGATKAFAEARKRLFDILVVDAKITFRNKEMGGLTLAEDMQPRYGDNSIIVISQFITEEMVHSHSLPFCFIPKTQRIAEFVRAICRKARELRRKQTVFIAMPFKKEYKYIYEKSIKPAIVCAGYHPVRMDEVVLTRSILQRIYEEIRRAKIVVFLADDANPNAYYEAGFADALHKEVVIIAHSAEVLKFDIQDRSTLFHAGDMKKLRRDLISKLAALHAV